MPFSLTSDLGKRLKQQGAQQPSKQRWDTSLFFIQSSEYPRGNFFRTVKPDDISTLPPIAVRPPAFPEMRKHSLQTLKPCVFFVQFPCRQMCRSMGICIHYQFVVGCRKCPDGLRCPICVESNVEQV